LSRNNPSRACSAQLANFAVPRIIGRISRLRILDPAGGPGSVLIGPDFHAQQQSTLLDDGLVSIKVSSIFLCRPARAPSITLLSSNGQEILKFRQTARTEAA
jgi:hypothetical protein